MTHDPIGFGQMIQCGCVDVTRSWANAPSGFKLLLLRGAAGYVVIRADGSVSSVYGSAYSAIKGEG